MELLLHHGAHLTARDKHGNTALDLALNARASASVAALVAAHARLATTSDRFNVLLIHALALDEVELVRRAVEDGWSPEQPILESLTAVDVAWMAGAKDSQVFLGGLAHAGTSRVAGLANATDTRPRLIVGSSPPDPRSWDRLGPALSVLVSGFVDEKGRFLVPTMTGCDDPQVTGAILNAIPTWQFEPARKDGRPVGATQRVALEFSERDNRVFASQELDEPPVRKTALNLNPSTYQVVSVTSLDHAQTYSRSTFPGGSGDYQAPVSEYRTTFELRERPGDFAVITLVVEPDGRATHARLIGSSKTEFPSIIFSALADLRFKPGLRRGVPVRSRMTLVLQPDSK